MGAEDDARVLLLQILDGRKGGTDSRIISYAAARVEGDVEVDAHQDALAPGVDVAHRLLHLPASMLEPTAASNELRAGSTTPQRARESSRADKPTSGSSTRLRD